MTIDPAAKIAALLQDLPDAIEVAVEAADVRAVLDELGQHRYQEILEPRDMARALSREKSDQIRRHLADTDQLIAERDAAVKSAQVVAIYLGRVEADRDRLRSELQKVQQVLDRLKPHLSKELIAELNVAACFSNQPLTEDDTRHWQHVAAGLDAS